MWPPGCGFKVDRIRDAGVSFCLTGHACLGLDLAEVFSTGVVAVAVRRVDNIYLKKERHSAGLPTVDPRGEGRTKPCAKQRQVQNEANLCG